MDRPEIAGLLERVRAATGPDQILDRRLCAALGIEPWTGGAAAWGVEEMMPGSPIAKATPRLTASVDAALSLVERFRGQGIDAATLLSDAIDRMTREGFRPDEALSPQLARAVLIELLTALPGGPDAG